jgi:hypothetical protein
MQFLAVGSDLRMMSQKAEEILAQLDRGGAKAGAAY